jgi:hypothetical protein
MNKSFSSLRAIAGRVATTWRIETKMAKQSISILLLLFLIGCAPQPLTVDRAQETMTPSRQPSAVSTSTPLRFDELNASPTVIVASTSTQIPTPQPSVTITAVGGNLYIRRGPDMAYNRIGVLKKGESAQVIAQDVLSNWVQINIPNSELTGWVSVMTNFSEITGDLKSLPNFTFTDYPQPAYIKNCTEHILLIMPGEYYLENLFTNAQYLNEVRVDSGVYSIYDVTLPDEPLIQTVDMQEGETAYITVNGLGVSHKCP